MGKIMTLKEREDLNKVYEKTLGEKGVNVFTYSDFLKDSGNNLWEHNFIVLFIEYFQNKSLFSNTNLILIEIVLTISARLLN